MYFEDLTPYEYNRERRNMLNVGWLSKEHPFAIGDTTAQFRRALTKLTAKPVNLCCGYHNCEFCEPPRRRVGHWGNGEIHVPATRGEVVYAAPQLVAHYVKMHNYLPPPPFVEAVLAYEVFSVGWKAKQEKEKEERRAEWKDRFPALDGQWTHWRLYNGAGDLLGVFPADELANALDMVERMYERVDYTGVSRSYREEDGDIEIERLCYPISYKSP